MKATHFNQVIETTEYKSLESRIIENYIKFHIETFEREPSKYDIEMEKIDFKIKLATMFDSYLLDSDIITVREIRSDKSNLAISMTVNRDGKDNGFITETIIAGGYVQVRHYRYIAHTKLTKQTNKDIQSKIKAERAKLTKIERFTKDKERYEGYLNKTINELDEAEKMSADDVLKMVTDSFNSNETYSRIMKMAYSDYVAGGGNANGFKSEKEFNENKERMFNEFVERNTKYHYNQIPRLKALIKEYTKSVEKQVNKINAL